MGPYRGTAIYGCSSRVALAHAGLCGGAADWREAAGQATRLFLIPRGSFTRRLPIGNSGRANVSAFFRIWSSQKSLPRRSRPSESNGNNGAVPGNNCLAPDSGVSKPGLGWWGPPLYGVLLRLLIIIHLVLSSMHHP